MKQEHLFEAIGLVDDRLVEEAADARRAATPWKKWAALAACLVLVIGIGSVSMSVLFRGCSAGSTTADTAVSTESTQDSTAETTDATATAPESAGTEETTTESTETTTDETTEETTNGSEATGGSEGETAAGAVLSCDNGMDLTATRRIQWTLEDAHTALVEDRYTVTNPGAAQTVIFRYPDLRVPDTELGATVRGSTGEYSLENGMLVIQVDLPAESTVEITVTYTLASEDGTFRVSTASDGLELTSQSAALVLPGDMTLAESNIDFQASGSAVTLDPAVEEYYFTVTAE